MADTISINLIPKTQLMDQYMYWSQFPVFEINYANTIQKGKDLALYHIDLTIDTSSNTLSETTAPTNVVLNFTTPVQVYLRSDNAGDTSKNIDVIGQKSDGSFGQFTLTSDDSDGTTAVNCGTWYFIAAVVENDSWTGNAILDDDGAGTTVYFQQAAGASSTTGIIVVPDGYHGAILTGYSTLTADPGSAGEGMNIDAGDHKAFLSRNQPESFAELKVSAPLSAQDRIEFKHKYGSAVTATFIHIFVIIWEA